MLAKSQETDIRTCPHCGGIGDCKRTEIVIPGVRKIRHYKCQSCFRWWQLPIVISYGLIRFIREDKNS